MLELLFADREDEDRVYAEISYRENINAHTYQVVAEVHRREGDIPRIEFIEGKHKLSIDANEFMGVLKKAIDGLVFNDD